MYKVGDKLLCKKTIKYDNEICFSENVEYIIERLNFKNLQFSIVDDTGTNFYFTYYDGELGFFNSESNNNPECYFYDYFYTEKEIRKLKLKKLAKR